MFFKSKKHLKVGSILLVAAAVFGSCAEERDPINRVQPYAINKKYFIGEDFKDNRDDPEWFTRTSVIDVGYGSEEDLLFPSTIGQYVGRIKWQITEDHLIGRSTFERIEGTDGKGEVNFDSNGQAIGSETHDGIVVASFRIQSHFDIVKSYNPTTGEEINVMEENSYDRPWYERQYMRVDWSSNESTTSYDFDLLSILEMYDSVTYEPLSYYVDDPNAEDAPHFDLDNGYFDVTTKVFATPGLIDISHFGWGLDSIPSCWMFGDFIGGTYPWGTCSALELTLRHSFYIKPESDFEPEDYSPDRFTTFGGFYIEKFGYSRNYGMTDTEWHRMLNKYQIWERSHYYRDPERMDEWVPCYTETPFGLDPNRDNSGAFDADGNPIPNGTADECEYVTELLVDDEHPEGIDGSHCDTFKQRCTLPYQARVPKPMAWYYTEGGDPNYYEPTELAANDWDVALRSAVQTAKYAECVRVGGQDEQPVCAAKFPMWTGQQDDNTDAVNLALEVDDCRHGVTHVGEGGEDETAEHREKRCTDLADSIGTKRGYTDGVIAVAKMPEMIVLCHSPVLFDDPAGCGEARLPENVTEDMCVAAKNALDPTPEQKAIIEPCESALRVRRGDIRYHTINTFPNAGTNTPWGIMVSAVDPKTGENFATSSNVFTWVNDYVGQWVVDQLRLFAGELDVSDITEATHVHDWAVAAGAAEKKGIFGGLTRKEVNKRIALVATGSTKAAEKLNMLDEQTQGTMELDGRAVQKLLRAKLQDVQASADQVNTMEPIYEARRRSARGTEFEAQLMTKPILKMYAADGLMMSDSIMDRISPLRGGNPGFQHSLELMKQNAFAKRGMCYREMAEAPFAIAGMSKVLQDKFGAFNPQEPKLVQEERAEKMSKYIAKKMHYGVIAHEMGHSVAHRHNFVSSSDAWNYRPQYWQLRTNNGKLAKQCTDLSETGEDCVGPRYFDPVTENEEDNMIWMFMNSSVMDYPGDYSQDFLGAAAWDFAAVRMFYGDVAAVYRAPRFRVDKPGGAAVLDKISTRFGGITGISYIDEFNASCHYTALQSNYELIEPNTCKRVNTADFVPARYDPNVDGAWNPVVDGLIVSINGGQTYTKCRQPQVDYVNWSSLRYPTAAEAGQYYRGWGAVDELGRTLVPYGFATDRWADIGNASVYRHDNGGDVYEIFNFLLTQANQNWIFDRYRRGKSTFSIYSAYNRSLSRYYQKVRDGAKGMTLYRNWLTDIAIEMGYNPDDFVLGQYAWLAPSIIASGFVFDAFARLLQSPEPGQHYMDPVTGVLKTKENQVVGDYSPTYVTIPNALFGDIYGNASSAGLALESALPEDQGDFDPDYTINAGSYYDKMNVAYLLTESVDNFISAQVNDFYDARFRATSVADLFPEGYRRLIANALTGDEEIKGTHLMADEKGRPLMDFENDRMLTRSVGWTSWIGDEVETCFPADGTTFCRGYSSADGIGTSVDNSNLNPQISDYVVGVDSLIGWEQQKFLIAWTMLYLPENQKWNWLNQLRVWEIGIDSDPEFDNRIEFHDPSGKIFVAKTFGREEIYGKTVQKGIAARVLEYANQLLEEAYVVESVDIDGDDIADWYEPVLDEETDQPIIKCWDTDDLGCECGENPICVKLSHYVSIPSYMRQAVATYNLENPEPDGVYQ
jgi:hypothetical protein